MKTQCLNILKKSDGAALVELAIILPVLLLLAFGVFELGRAIQAKNIITNMSREGANLAARPGIKNTNEAYVDTRLLAMKMKKAFQERNEGNKNDYLKKFAEAAGILQKDYTNYRMSNQSLELLQFLDTDLLIKSRKQNAAFLIAELQTISQLELIFNEVKEQDVPLFVPILVKNGMRDKLSQYLISKEIFCPVHWPISKWHTISEKSKEIYHQELSLVCDQRYNLNDMARLVQEIRNFFNNT